MYLSWKYWCIMKNSKALSINVFYLIYVYIFTLHYTIVEIALHLKSKSSATDNFENHEYNMKLYDVKYHCSWHLREFCIPSQSMYVWDISKVVCDKLINTSSFWFIKDDRVWHNTYHNPILSKHNKIWFLKVHVYKLPLNPEENRSFYSTLFNRWSIFHNSPDINMMFSLRVLYFRR